MNVQFAESATTGAGVDTKKTANTKASDMKAMSNLIPDRVPEFMPISP
jgi:hypothetical protein